MYLYQTSWGSVGCTEEGVELHIFLYLDDWLAMAESQDDRCCAGFRCCIFLGVCHQLGQVLPTHHLSVCTPRFSGGTVIPALKQVRTVQVGIGLLSQTLALTAHFWLVILDLLVSLVELVPSGRLYMRPLQLHLLAFFRTTSRDVTAPLPSAQYLIEVFGWFCNETNMSVMSFSHWPACTHPDDGFKFGGLGSNGTLVREESQRDSHNVLELLVFFTAICPLGWMVHGLVILVLC